MLIGYEEEELEHAALGVRCSLGQQSLRVEAPEAVVLYLRGPLRVDHVQVGTALHKFHVRRDLEGNHDWSASVIEGGWRSISFGRVAMTSLPPCQFAMGVPARVQVEAQQMILHVDLERHRNQSHKERTAHFAAHATELRYLRTLPRGSTRAPTAPPLPAPPQAAAQPQQATDPVWQVWHQLRQGGVPVRGCQYVQAATQEVALNLAHGQLRLEHPSAVLQSLRATRLDILR